MQAIAKNNTDIACDNVDLNENSRFGLKGEAQRGIRTEASGISWAEPKSGIVQADCDLVLDDCGDIVLADRKSFIPVRASPVHVEECSGCGVRTDGGIGGCGTEVLSTVREEEEDDDEDEVYYSNMTESCSVLSSSFDSLNSSTELLLNVAHPQPGILSELPETHAGVGELLSSMMEDKTSQLGKISMRCSNCLEKFHWATEELEACLLKHLAQCWQRKKGVAYLSQIDKNETENELEAFEKEFLRSEFSDVKSLVSAMLANEWDLKPTRCTPECNREHCREARNEDLQGSDSDDLDDTESWDEAMGNKDACIDGMLKTEEVENEDMERKYVTEELNDFIVAEQRMLVFLVSSRDSIWQDKMAVVLGLPTHATLDDLDSVLRRLWVECCGHASSLTMGQRGETFSFPDLVGGLDKLSITEKEIHGNGENRTGLETLFEKIGSTASYTYDPKRPTTLNISFMGTEDLTLTEEAEFPANTDFYLRGDDMLRPSHKTPMSSVVLLRNIRPEVVCFECHQSYVLLLDSGIMDLQPRLISAKPHEGLFQPIGFCCMDCVVSFNEKMSLLPDSIQVDRSQLVYMSNSPRAGMCRYASLELDSSVNSRSTEGTTYSAFTMDTSCSCVDCASDCSQNCSTCDNMDTDHSYSKSEGSPRVTSSFLRNVGTGGTPVLTGYNSRSTSVDTPTTRQ